MATHTNLLAIAVSIAIVATGCVASQLSPSPSRALPTSSPTPSLPAPSTPSPAVTASPAVGHAAPDLEALLPARIGDAQLIRSSGRGSDFVESGDVCSLVCPAEPRLMVESVGATRDDLTIAFAYEQVDNHFGRYALVAWRVRGVSGAALRAGRLTMGWSEPPYPIVGDLSAAGRTVTVAIKGWSPNMTEFMVVNGDALIMILAATPEDQTGKPVLPDEVRTVVAALP